MNDIFNPPSKSTKKLGIDLDDVLNTFNPDWIDLYNKKYGKKFGVHLQEKDITDWDLHKFVHKDVNLFQEFILQPSFFLNSGVQKNAVKCVDKLLDVFEEVYIVSASHFSTVPFKAEWIVKNLPNFPIKNFIPCYKKYMINIDGLVDDGYHNLETFPRKRILFDKPWNRQYQNEANGKDMIVVNGWSKDSVNQIIKFMHEN